MVTIFIKILNSSLMQTEGGVTYSGVTVTTERCGCGVVLCGKLTLETLTLILR